MSSNIDTDSLPFLEGAVAGVLAWVLGYVFTYLIAGTGVRDSPLNQFLEAFGDGGAVYEVVGWVFFNAHFVDTIVDVQIGIFGSTNAVSFIGGEDGFTPILYVIPVALLFAAGLAMTRYQGLSDVSTGAIAGALVVPGYLLLCLVGAFLFQVDVGDSSGGPDILTAIVLAGIVYPAVFGAFGGAVGAATAEDTSG